MNLNLELHFKPSCSLLKHQKEYGTAIPTIKLGTTSSLNVYKTHPVAHCCLPLSVCFSEADFISSAQPVLSEPSRIGRLSPFPSRAARVAWPRSYQQKAHGALGDAPRPCALVPEPSLASGTG